MSFVRALSIRTARVATPSKGGSDAKHLKPIVYARGPILPIAPCDPPAREALLYDWVTVKVCRF